MEEITAIQIDEIQVKMLEFLASPITPESAKIDFIKSMLGVLEENVLTKTKWMVKREKRRIRYRRENVTKEGKKGEDNSGSAVLQPSIDVFQPAVPPPSVPVPSVPVAPVPVQPQPKPWWTYYKKSDILAFDCEHVHLKHLSGEKRIKAGSVSVVDFYGNRIYDAKVMWPIGSFIVNQYTIAKNGFHKDSLVYGTPIEKVSKHLQELFIDKMVITCGGTTDYLSLNLKQADYDGFDLHDYYYYFTINVDGVMVLEKISLKKLVKYYIGVDIQTGIHDPFIDAKYTMEIFRNHYINEKLDKNFRYLEPGVDLTDIANCIPKM